MKNYEDKIYSLGETVTGQTQAMLQVIQKTLENNGGVGIMTGSYDQNLSILSVDNLLLHSTGSVSYTHLDVYKRQVYDRLSENEKCELYVLYRSKKNTDGSWYISEAEILEMCIRDRLWMTCSWNSSIVMPVPFASRIRSSS